MKKKLKIQELKIQSFVTELDLSTAKTAKGGSLPFTTSTSDSNITVCGPVDYTTTRAKSWWPYDSQACAKITTTTTSSAPATQ